jgi:hypothetical protein
MPPNSKFHHDQYFSMLPTGPEPQKAFSYGLFELAAGAKPRPKTVAIVAADAEQKYPPPPTYYAPVMHAIKGHRLRGRLSARLRRHRSRRQ